ncbi:MAG: DUF4282 domain-containing protein [Oscillospiraceae bacterium]|nr:DUF4282 domain-containing protein [Oscillospiraceae bacterium]
MPIEAALIIGGVLALAGTIVSYILLIPEKRKANLNKFFTFVRNVFTFKHLLLESILRALYVFSTFFVIFAGFFMLFSGYRRYSWYGGGFESAALEGLLTMVLGPIAVRLAYEAMMLFVLLVKNTIAINTKLESKPGKESETPNVPENIVFCQFCGTKYNANIGGCPNNCAPQPQYPQHPPQQ